MTAHTAQDVIRALSPARPARVFGGLSALEVALLACSLALIALVTIVF